MLVFILQWILCPYLVVSIFFFLFPKILHAQHRLPQIFQDVLDGKKMLRVAHRGGSRINIENTTLAFD